MRWTYGGEMLMNKSAFFAGVILIAGMLLTPARAQEMGKKGPTKAAPSPSEAVIEQWNDIGRKLIAMGEDFSEDKYDFKAAPTTRTFAERLIHAAHGNQFFINALAGEKMPEMDDPKREQFKSKAEIVAFVK